MHRIEKEQRKAIGGKLEVMGVATEHIATVEHPMQRHSIIHRKKTKKNKSKATLFALLMLSLKLTNSHKCFNKKKKEGGTERGRISRGVMGFFSLSG